MGAFDDLLGYRDILDSVLKIRRKAIQFTGTGVSVADDATNERTVVTITAGGAVDSVHGRTGTVVATAGDYSASEITNDSSVTGANVDDALDALDAAANVVESVHSRTGAVVAAAGDYSASEVTNDSGVSGVNVDDALDQLDTDIGAIVTFDAPTDPGDDGKFAIADSGNLVYKTGVAVQTLCSLRAEPSPGTSTSVDANWEPVAVFSTPAGWEANSIELCILAKLDVTDGTGHLALFDTGLADDGTGSVSPVEVTGSELSFTTTANAWKKTGNIAAIAANKVYLLQAEVYGDSTGTNNMRIVGAEIRQT
ncbi:MAG: hypothetical protein ACPGVY_14900 [Mycobacterium sp.]